MSDVEVAASGLPMLKARRTLLIGLGTTGAMVCRQILDRLTWSYDSPENVSWLKCVVLETAKLKDDEDQHLAHAAHVPLTITRDKYQPVMTTPEQLDSIDLKQWFDYNEFGKGDTFTHAIEDGANNHRMLGRLALLYPDNYSAARTAIKRELDTLNALDSQRASLLFHTTGERKNVDFADGPGGAQKRVYVYVVGSLCGGTSSGSFIDLGYLLQNLPGYSNLLSSTGVFLLPPTGHEEPKQSANAYAALRELNHYSSGRSRYSQKIADNPNPILMPYGTSPYKYQYLLQPHGTHPEDYPRTITAAADYVYSDAILGGNTDDIRTNIATYIDVPDRMGASQKFFTFGVGTLEFPYTKVLKALSLKLFAQGLGILLGRETLMETALAQRFAALPLLQPETLKTELMKFPVPETEAVKYPNPQPTLFSEMEALITTSDLTPAELNGVEQQIDSAFTSAGDSQVSDRLPRNIVRTARDRNRPPLQDALLKSVQGQVESFLTGTNPAGLTDLEIFLKGLQARLEENKKACLTWAINNQMLETAHAAEANAKHCETDFFLGLALARKSSIQRYLAEWKENYLEYVASCLSADAMNDCLLIYGDVQTYVTSVLGRIERENGTGLIREASALREKMLSEYTKMDRKGSGTLDGSERLCNGTELFEAGETLPAEYERSLREKSEIDNLPGNAAQWERAYALKAVAEWARKAFGQTTAPPRVRTDYDRGARPELPAYNLRALLEIARPAREFFSTLKDHTIHERLLQLPALLDGRLRDANADSRYLLNWTGVPDRHVDAPNKHWETAKMISGAPAEFETAMNRAGVIARRQVINDPHQILFVQERGAFSLGTLQDVQNDRAGWPMHYGQDLHAHSRTDVTRAQWLGWEKQDEESYRKCRQAFLVGVALKIVQFVRVTEYHFHHQPNQPGQQGIQVAKLSNDLGNASFAILTGNLEPEISLRIEEERRRNGATHIFYELMSFLDNYQANGFVERGQGVTKDGLIKSLFDYVRRDPELFALYTEKYPNLAELRYLKRDPDGKFLPNDGYYCDGCNGLLGYRSEDLYQTVTTPTGQVEVMMCALCGKRL